MTVHLYRDGANPAGVRRLSLPLAPRSVRYLAVGAVAGVIAYFSLATAPPAGPEAGPWWDEKLHFVAYAGLGLATAYATAHYRSRPGFRVALVVGVPALFGVGIELLQWTLPARSLGVGDALANVAGGLAATGWLAVERRVAYAPMPGGD